MRVGNGLTGIVCGVNGALDCNCFLAFLALVLGAVACFGALGCCCGGFLLLPVCLLLML